MTVAIINYKLGNLTSVYNAFEFLGYNTIIADEPGDLVKASHVILPGVGAFGVGISNLKESGFIEAIHEHATIRKKPFIGICLGMHLLADKGTEYGDFDGLGLIKGRVERFSEDLPLHIPHIGWNTVAAQQHSKTYESIEDGDYYFVHSYIFKPEDERVISGVCNYGGDFVASVEDENIWGAQFHPEKSQQNGLALLNNFMKL